MQTRALFFTANLILFTLLNTAAAAEQWWQLTFTYNPRGLFLLRAGQVAPLTKAVSSPGLGGAAVRLEYDLEWLDAQGRLVQTTPIQVPLGGHVVMTENGIAPDSSRQILPEDTFVVRTPGPTDAQSVFQVRLVQRAGGGQAALALAQGQVQGAIPPAFQIPAQTFVLPIAPAAPAPGPVAAEKVRNSGPDANRFVIAILCDGFTATNLASGSFTNKVKSFLSSMFNTIPWKNYTNMVNVYRVDIESAESGADYEDASPDAGGTQRDTYLNGGFWVGGTDRCAYLRGSGVDRAFAAADELVGVGVWDEVLVFLNSTKYGGCGGALGVATLNGSSDEVEIHEFGHSFGHLADEYDYGSSSTNCTPSSTRNVDCPNNFPAVKWQVWVTNGTPIPTPDTSAYDNVVGAFEGAATQRYGVYRPMRNCKMRSLGIAFCPICKEDHVLKLFEEVRMLDAADPPLGPADVPSYGSRQFSVTPINVAGLNYQWFTNGAPVPAAAGTSLALAGSEVFGTNFELRLEITHTTALVRAEQIIQTNTWLLRAVPEPAILIANAKVVEGNVGDTNLAFTVRLSYAHTNTVSVRYATADGTATAGTDYTATNGVLTFAPGQTTNFVYVTVHGDTLTEPDEVLFVNLSSPTNATLTRPQAAGLILDRDQAPGIALVAPAAGETFSAPANITLSAEAFDVDGFVSRVEFFAGANRLGQVDEAPFTFTWSNVPPGNYVFTAMATDNTGKSATSAPVSVSVLAGAAQELTLLPLTNAWRYDATTNDYGTDWKEPGYNDTAWSGPALALLHNEGDTIPGPKNTQIPLTYNGARILGFYFRTHFNFPTNSTAGLLLVSSNLIDDGAVFWLNGQVAARLRMPAGTITRTNLATGTPPSGDAIDFEVINLPTTNLFPGDNVLAVEVHQNSATSSDMVFGMSLTAVLGFAPIITDPTQPADRTVVQGRSTTLNVYVAASPTPTYRWYRNGVGAGSGPSFTIGSMSPGAAGQFHVTASNVLGMVTSRVAVVSYEADITPPGLVYAVGSTNLRGLIVSFSEPVVAAGATTLANYRLASVTTGSNLLATAASLQNGTNVLLTTQPRSPTDNYVLTVNNVRDSAGNVIPTNSAIAVATEVLLIPPDGWVWRYFQSDREPGFGWAVPGFTDFSEWGIGAALFDAKSPAGRTSVGPNNVPVRTSLNLVNPPGAAAQTTTYYFLTTFNLPGPAAGARLNLRALVDDGAVFYLNGQEVYRLRLPPTPALIGYTNFATASQVDSQNVFEGPFALPADALQDGENLLAVEVHQAGATSSDMSFAAQLMGELPQLGFPSFKLTITGAGGPAGYVLTWDRADAVLEEAPSVTGPWTPVTPAAVSPHPVLPEGAAKFYRLQAPR